MAKKKEDEIKEVTAVEEVVVEPAIDVKTSKKAGPKSKRTKQETDEPATEEAKEESATKKEKHAKAKPEVKVRAPRKRGKKYKEVAKLVEPDKLYPLAEAVDLAKKTSTTKFDSTVELHFNLGVDPKQADQMVRGTLVLPAGSGKSLRVAVMAAETKKADAVGADLFGEDKITQLLESEKLEFDILIATPDMMPKLAKYAKILGPKGLMPNPKSGTVTNQITQSIKDLKAGKIEFRIDRQSIIHQAIGKVSFTNEQLLKNASSLIAAVNKAKPAASKGTYFEAITLTTTMGPGIKIDVPEAVATAKN